MDKLEEEMAREIYESIFVDSFDDTHGIERAQYLQAGRACAVIARKQVEELEAAIGYHAEQASTYLAQATISEKDLASARWHNDKIRAALQRKGVEPK